ncbi:dioxygenase [uncultured Adlercreutzia sp.]|uniref:dioxygenase n=1 Tax=uncultured Adlercreutzia sp. TaxID=875803 RepID=UPI0025F17EA3|nr:dioxygenase [uncultured Adlercreutzia sp.]
MVKSIEIAGSGAREQEVMLAVPEAIRQAPGIAVAGRKIRSLVFSTDLAVICHCDADAVLAVYPFTCQPAITSALVAASQRPVFNGVGGSITQGERCVEAALHSEMCGVASVVVNASIPVETIEALVSRVGVPVTVTACEADGVVRRQIEAGATLVNVAAGPRTAEVVGTLRAAYPELPIIATGGATNRSMEATLAAGADALSWTPPAIADLERAVMEKARRLARG